MISIKKCLSLFLIKQFFFLFFLAEDGIRDGHVTGVQTCALPISRVVACLDGNASDPAGLARAYDAQGADEIVLLDAGTAPRREETIGAVRAVASLPLTVGGGIASIEDAARAIDAGADRVVI